MLEDQPMKRPAGHPSRSRRLGDVPVGLRQTAGQDIPLEGVNHPRLGAGEAVPVVHLQPAALDVQGQVFHLNLPTRRQDDTALDGVLQLAEVSRPGVVLQTPDRIW